MSRATLVVPCYNEAKRLQLNRFESFLGRSDGMRVLFVDDGSRDNTGAMLQTFCSAMPDRASVLSLASNSGKAEAVRRGIIAAMEQGAPFVGFWDADLATPLETVDLFLAEMAEYPTVDLIMGSRVLMLGRSIERRPVRHYAGRGFATVVTMILNLDAYDTQCGAKLFRSTPALRDVFNTPFLSRWIFDVEVLARLSIEHARRGEPPLQACVRELPLPVWRDVAGSKLRFADIATVARDLVAIARWLRQARRANGAAG